MKKHLCFVVSASRSSAVCSSIALLFASILSYYKIADIFWVFSAVSCLVFFSVLHVLIMRFVSIHLKKLEEQDPFQARKMMEELAVISFRKFLIF